MKIENTYEKINHKKSTYITPIKIKSLYGFVR